MYQKPRFASVETKDECHFLTLEKDDYNRVIGEIEERRVAEEIRNLRKFSILQFLTRITLHKLYYSSL